MTILIAGGTGFIGQGLSLELVAKGHTVLILSRHPKAENQFYWNPATGDFPLQKAFKQVDVIINLSGENINSKRWTTAQKRHLFSSRIASTHLLYQNKAYFPELKQYVSASGITAYPFDDGVLEWDETATYGTSFIAQLVKDWEAAADLFSSFVPVTKLRIAVVLEKSGGALPLFVKLTKLNLGGPVGTGQQQIPWVSRHDLVRQFLFVIEHRLEGTFNTNAGNCSNQLLMEKIRTFYGKKFCPPAVPSFIIRLLFGEQSILMLKGNKASNKKIVEHGFTFDWPEIEEVLQNENLI